MVGTHGSAQSVIDCISRHDACFLDLRFTDIKGVLHSTSVRTDFVTEQTLSRGFSIDGSSFRCWKSSHDSELTLLPDYKTAALDPRIEEPTVALICDVQDAGGEPYSRDPRHAARRAERYMHSFEGIDDFRIGIELEFFMFDSARFESSYNRASFEVDDAEADYNSNTTYTNGNLANRSQLGDGLHSMAPADRSRSIRDDIVMELGRAGIPVMKHHHEASPAQHEISINHDGLLSSADRVQIAKYLARRVGFEHGKSVTFMPKPVSLGTGSGMHVNVSLKNAGISALASTDDAPISRHLRFFLGGLLLHGQALNAFCNASTNSYRRLASRSKSGLSLSYGLGNRDAAIRIPKAQNESDNRLEIRFPDATANPYLAFAAILMAGLDGLENSIEPGAASPPPSAGNPQAARAEVPHSRMASSLEGALAALNADRAFLLKGDVFSNGLINAFVLSKDAEIRANSLAPTPQEFQHYYSC